MLAFDFIILSPDCVIIHISLMSPALLVEFIFIDCITFSFLTKFLGRVKGCFNNRKCAIGSLIILFLDACSWLELTFDWLFLSVVGCSILFEWLE
ncbi:unnamed protein product [Moneuplotes crassus]|uniref:Uncharacterized protein n=1 Tax=Euplotes crassus TaxID=5936 RepID=A0AAD1XLJ1_EUPCR|nr:unnamed protein product [Moneuplotes crassus]